MSDHEEHHDASSHDHEDHGHDAGKKKAKGAEIKQAPTWPIGLVILIVVIALGYRACGRYEEGKKAEEKKAAEITQVVAQQPVRTVEDLRSTDACTTPCTLHDIAYKFKIRVDGGHSFRVKYHGSSEWVYYPAEGDFKPPENMEAGDAEVESTDKDQPHFLVQLYQKVKVPITGGW